MTAARWGLTFKVIHVGQRKGSNHPNLHLRCEWASIVTSSAATGERSEVRQPAMRPADTLGVGVANAG